MPPTVTVENCEHCPFRGQGSLPSCVARENGIPGRRPSHLAVLRSAGWISKKGPPPKTCPLRSGEVVVRIGGAK